MVASVSPQSQAVVYHPNPSTFWQHRWVQNVVPLTTSLLLHLSILAIGIVLYKVVAVVNAPARQQLTIPESTFIPKADAMFHSNSAELPMDRTQQDKVREIDDGSFDTGAKGKTDSLLSARGETETAFLGAQAAVTGTATGSDLLGGGGSGVAPFGAVPRHGSKPGVFIPGITTDRYASQRTVFLCDASGSMLGVFGTLKQRMKESIAEMNVTNGSQFNVIFFSDENVSPLFKDGVQLATDHNKKLAMEFIDNAVATGGTQPLPAIRFAMAEKPELIFVLTDGFDQIANFDEVVNAFRQGNKDGKIQVNTIFLESESDPHLEKTLQKIADEGHGKFTKVRKQDM